MTAPAAFGSLRATVFGFLLGASLAGSVALTSVVAEHHKASNILLTCLEDVQTSASKIKESLTKYDALENRITKLETLVATKTDLKNTHSSLIKDLEDLRLTQLELKTRVWDLLGEANPKK